MSTTPVSEARRKVIQAAQGTWIKLLIDLSRRNTLLYFRPWKLASAELTQWDQDSLQRLLAGEAMPLVQLLPQERELTRRRDSGDDEATIYTEEGADDDLSEQHLGLLPRLLAISRKAQENFEERGMETMFLAYGMASWKADDGGRDPDSAVLLLPIAVEGTGRKRSLIPRGDLQTNLTLLYRFEQLSAGDLTQRLEDAIADPAEIASGRAHTTVFDKVSRAASHIPGFQLSQRVVIGNFSFEKLAMVKDLEANLDGLVRNDIVAALAGDVEAAANLRKEWEAGQIDHDTLDSLPASAEFLVAPADSSQQAALVMVARGQSGVISGPPGTGKSQTITNLIANSVAAGKSVLFVAQKRAALEVVKRRLEAVGLGHLVLDLHGQTKKAEVMRQFAESYELIRASSAVDAATLDGRFEERRKHLNDYVERLHRKRVPSGLSVYEIQAAILGANDSERTNVRWEGQSLHKLNPERVQYVKGLLEQAGGLADLFLRKQDVAWAGARLTSAEQVTAALGALDYLANGQLSEFRRAATAFGSETGFSTSTLAEVQVAGQFAAATRAILANYEPQIFGLDLATAAAQMAPARSTLKRAWASTFDKGYRAARDRLRELRFGMVDDARLLQEASEADRLVRGWLGQTHGKSRPFAASTLEPFVVAISQFSRSWDVLRELIDWGDAAPELVEDLAIWISDLDRERGDAFRIPHLWQIERGLELAGLSAFVADLRDRRPTVESWVRMFEYGYHQSCLQAAWLEDPQLAAFDGRSHDQVIEDFKRLDRQRTEIASARVRHAHAKRAITVRDSEPQQEAVVRAEAKKKSRHKTVRALIAEAPDVVTALRPCWMASPLSVSQLLAGDARYFDVVIFDEASQVLPEDAVTSILRGHTVVVAGDEKQLPPTPFFASGVEELESSRDEADPVEGYESVLEMMGKIFDPWDLRWHYRSQDERLIAFSNRHIYLERLITFPGVGLVEPVRFLEVDQELGIDGQEESSSAEVKRVVEVIMEHARERPGESLGVIAMGIKHAYRIEAELARRRVEQPELDDFFGSHPNERFFVKNLERVQGDERDAIILSIGYGKNRAGTLGLNFGPLTNTKTGHRRLNVAVTRAKRSLAAIASFSAADMDPKRLNALGMKLTRAYLEYASAGGRVLGDSGQQPVALNGFEQSVMRALEEQGIGLIPQYGAGAYRLDFAVQHPLKKGRLVMAVECDGATYHSANTARDRDRLRQEHLELLGWRFCRIWSTDWYRARNSEIDRVVKAYHEAVRAADALDQGETNEHSSYPAPPAPKDDQVIVPLPTKVISGPRIRGLPIGQYSTAELRGLKAQVESDGQLRTKEELLREMSDRLGYDRLGSVIRTRLQGIIDGTDAPPNQTAKTRRSYPRRNYRRW